GAPACLDGRAPTADFPSTSRRRYAYSSRSRKDGTRPGRDGQIGRSLEHDPEKWIPVFGKACPRARPEGSCSNNKPERDGDSKKSHLALGSLSVAEPRLAPTRQG